MPLPITTALLTDHYELTMVKAALASGAAHRRAVFEVFARRLPHGRRYGVVAGTGRLLGALEGFRFGSGTLDFLRTCGGPSVRSASPAVTAASGRSGTGTNAGTPRPR